MAIPAAAIAKAAIGVLSNEKTRKAAGWVLVAILSPIILLYCCIRVLSWAVPLITTAASLTVVSMVAHYQQISCRIPSYIEDMQASFALLDERIAEINSMTEDGESLDAIRVKAFFMLCISARSHRAASAPTIC